MDQKQQWLVCGGQMPRRERIWVLYSRSIRSVPGSSKFLSDITSQDASLKRMFKYTNAPLNIQDVIKLAPSVKLTQSANHDPTNIISNKKTFTSCPSCANVDIGEHFQPVPYKTIISHYEQALATAGGISSWPPHPDVIKSAGGVGFGPVKGIDEDAIVEEDIVIPPVIRHLHKRLKTDGYRRYRSDPLFLHKHCKVCEDCFLAYAKLVSTSFQITRPIQMDTDLKRLGFASLDEETFIRSTSKVSSAKHAKNQSKPREKNTSSFGELFVQGPSLPPAIIDPPNVELEVDHKKSMLLPYESVASPHQPLMHLITIQQKLKNAKSKANTHAKAKLNPYQVPLKFVDTPSKSTNRKKIREDKGWQGL